MVVLIPKPILCRASANESACKTALVSCTACRSTTSALHALVKLLARSLQTYKKSVVLHDMYIHMAPLVVEPEVREKATILKLPDSVLNEILRLLTAADIVVLGSTCKFFH